MYTYIKTKDDTVNIQNLTAAISQLDEVSECRRWTKHGLDRIYIDVIAKTRFSADLYLNVTTMKLNRADFGCRSDSLKVADAVEAIMANPLAAAAPVEDMPTTERVWEGCGYPGCSDAYCDDCEGRGGYWTTRVIIPEPVVVSEPVAVTVTPAPKTKTKARMGRPRDNPNAPAKKVVSVRLSAEVVALMESAAESRGVLIERALRQMLGS